MPRKPRKWLKCPCSSCLFPTGAPWLPLQQVGRVKHSTVLSFKMNEAILFFKQVREEGTVTDTCRAHNCACCSNILKNFSICTSLQILLKDKRALFRKLKVSVSRNAFELPVIDLLKVVNEHPRALESLAGNS